MAETKTEIQPKNLPESWQRRQRLSSSLEDNSRVLEQIAYENIRVRDQERWVKTTQGAIEAQQRAWYIFGRDNVVSDWTGGFRDCALLEEMVEEAEIAIKTWKLGTKRPMRLVIQFDDFLESRYGGIMEGIGACGAKPFKVIVEKLKRRVESATEDKFTVDSAWLNYNIPTDRGEVKTGVEIYFGYKIPREYDQQIRQELGKE